MAFSSYSIICVKNKMYTSKIKANRFLYSILMSSALQQLKAHSYQKDWVPSFRLSSHYYIISLKSIIIVLRSISPDKVIELIFISLILELNWVLLITLLEQQDSWVFHYIKSKAFKIIDGSIKLGNNEVLYFSGLSCDVVVYRHHLVNY